MWDIFSANTASTNVRLPTVTFPPPPAFWCEYLIVFHIIKPIRCTNFSNLYWNETLYVSDSSSVHHQELFAVHTAVVYVYVILFCRQLTSRIRMDPSWSYLQAVCKPVWHILLLCVQWKTPDGGQRNCPKYVEFHSKKKFWEIGASIWFYCKKFITMHGHMNVKLLGCNGKF
jgi:hypothetical protein